MRTVVVILLTAFSFLLLPSHAVAQPRTVGIVQLRNASFEDLPRNSMPPIGWADCGFPAETPPDVQPDPLKQFQVSMAAQHGNTYLGMVVRDNDTWESVGQELSEPLSEDQCYDFRIQLARSQVYLSQSRVSNREANYVTPVKLRIHGGYDLCQKLAILGETPLVTNYTWKEYRIKLTAKEAYTHIIFEVFYQTPTLIPYNGNLLLDNAGPLVPIDCNKEPSDGPLSNPINDTPLVLTPIGKSNPKPPTNTEPTKPLVKLGNTRAELKVNSVFQIENISFRPNSSELEEQSLNSLQEIIDFLRQNPKVSVEIGGHASGQAGNTFAQAISEARAKSVVDYLRRQGIDTRRLYPIGYGKSRRICYEDTNECRRRNQRVEVKIISVDRER